MANAPLSDEANFRTLISAAYALFKASFQPPSLSPDFYPKFGQFPTTISSKRRSIFATDGLPMIFLEFWKNHGKCAAALSDEAHFRTLIAAVYFPV